MGHENGDGAPALDVKVNGVPLDSIAKLEEQTRQKLEVSRTDAIQAARQKLQRSGGSYTSTPPPGSILTGKQEHCTKGF